jgi:uncharacterized protein (UPF0248 family)
MVHPPRNPLNRLRWGEREDPAAYEILYGHRGAPGDVKRINATKIQRLGKSYFTIQEGYKIEEVEASLSWNLRGPQHRRQVTSLGETKTQLQTVIGEAWGWVRSGELYLFSFYQYLNFGPRPRVRVFPRVT